MLLTIKVNGTLLKAKLLDNPTARDFYSLLPLSLTLKDYASTEKIAYLDRKLSTEQAPDGIAGKKGDITYYAPWGNLAIFYKDFGYAKGLIKLGQLEGDFSVLRAGSDLPVLIEPAD